MSFMNSLKVAASALRAQRERMTTITSNLANAETTRTAAGGPYKRLDPVFVSKSVRFDDMLSGVETVEIAAVVEDTKPAKMVYDPDHPDADDKGCVAMPNVNIVQEMVDMVSAARSYEAATAAVRTAKAMANEALDIGG